MLDGVFSLGVPFISLFFGWNIHTHTHTHTHTLYLRNTL